MKEKIELNKELLLDGIWWLTSGKEKDGKIVYTPNTKLELEINGEHFEENSPFFPTHIDDGKGNYKVIEQDKTSKTIFGRTKDNIPITLIDCRAYRSNIGSDVSTKTIYMVKYLIYGLHIGKLKDLRFKWMIFQISGLRQFIGSNNNICNYDVEDLNKEKLIKSYAYNDFKLDIKIYLDKLNNYIMPNKNSALSQFETFLEISKPNTDSYDNYIELLDAFKDLVSLGLNNATSVDAIKGYTKENEVQILFVLEKHNYKLKPNKHIFNIYSINSNVAENWFKLYFENENILKTFCSTIQNEGSKRLYIDNVFFNYISVFEGLHRVISEEKFISINNDDEKGIREKLKEITEDLSNHRKRLLKEKFTYLPKEMLSKFNLNLLGWTLKDRLLNTYNEFFDYFDAEKINNSIKFIINQRNGIAHGWSTIERNSIKLYKHNIKLKKMNYLLLTKRIGLEIDTFKRIDSIICDMVI